MRLRAAAAVAVLSLPAAVCAASLTSLVNPLIGSRGGGGLGGWGMAHTNPGAMYPFAGMRLGPDTSASIAGSEVWTPLLHKAGYFGSDGLVRGFSASAGALCGQDALSSSRCAVRHA
jgi:putative alpha-1,2-mannosidase